VARPEPENSVLELIRGFSTKSWPFDLAVVGNYHGSAPFQRAVRDAASAREFEYEILEFRPR